VKAQRNWGLHLGAITAIITTALATVALAAMMCESSGGHLTNFGRTCEALQCPAYPISHYMTLEIVAIAFIFAGLPAGLVAAAAYARWFGPGHAPGR
jgi:hypothetical protein